MAGVFPNAPATGAGGRTVFEWMPGEQFMIQRWEVRHPAAPDGVAIIGFDEARETYLQHYFDSARRRTGVRDELRFRRLEALPSSPDFSPLHFSQRFTGAFSDNTIDGRWEASRDGTSWEHDFDLTYTKVA